MSRHLINSAREFATLMHKDQVRKYTGQPYILHPEEVALLVEVVGGSYEQIAAAWLHDVQEDCGVTNEEIKEKFGEVVARYVDQLTDVSKPSDGNRKTRKAIDLAHTADAEPSAMTIKLADIISNSQSIVRYDPEFARTYMVEKCKQIEVLQYGNAQLYRVACRIFEDYCVSMGVSIVA